MEYDAIVEFKTEGDSWHRVACGPFLDSDESDGHNFPSRVLVVLMRSRKAESSPLRFRGALVDRIKDRRDVLPRLNPEDFAKIVMQRCGATN